MNCAETLGCNGRPCEIEVAGLTRTFGNTTAVDGIEFRVGRGELFAFLGPNGAGKTTTINMLTGLLKPDAGEVRYHGELFDSKHLSVKRLIGVVPQHNNLDRELTAAENLLIHGRLFGMSGKELQHRIDICLEFADLSTKRDIPAGKLSGGMKRKLVIARALLHQPEILFLDEPTVGLDPHSRRKMWAFLRRINLEQNCTVFLTTHYIEEADALADRVLIIDQARIIACGTPEQLKRSAGNFVLDIYAEEEIQSEFFEERAQAMQRLEQLDTSVRIREITLEDVFLQLTGKRIET
ncbi:MAG TPA: ABC transporter ATP-binding protein [Geopsychrobacteraceae bacterium]|nr:ABC transporter ATP-binding protein [Geopsychrobacteraceae bacterium]